MSKQFEGDAGQRLAVSVVIPTYRREQVLVDSLNHLLALTPAPDEIVVVDQTESHAPQTVRQLQALNRQGIVRWIRRDVPSIPGAMNAGLRAARHDIVLFLDDDILPDGDLICAHAEAQRQHPGLIAGQVLQPGETPVTLASGQSFRFNSCESTWIDEFMGGNFSIRREVALSLGGFDENFIGAAYRFEAEFAHRYTSSRGRIRFEPGASIHHLQATAGGTRAHGHHLRTVRPTHSVGAYYYWLRTRGPRWWWSMLLRPLRAVRTRHHLRRPWWIPLTLLAEGRGMLQAVKLWRQGPKLLTGDAAAAPAGSPAPRGADCPIDPRAR